MLWGNRRSRTDPYSHVGWYVRESGCVVAYAPIFAEVPDDAMDARVGELLASGLGWIWQSGRHWPAAEDSPMHDQPQERGLTKLMPQTAATLTADLVERDSGGDRRSVSLFGVDNGAAEALLDRNTLIEAIRAFETREEGLVHMLIVQVGDLNYDEVYVCHRPSAAVQSLLNAWNIPSLGSRLARTSPYRPRRSLVDVYRPSGEAD